MCGHAWSHIGAVWQFECIAQHEQSATHRWHLPNCRPPYFEKVAQRTAIAAVKKIKQVARRSGLAGLNGWQGLEKHIAGFRGRKTFWASKRSCFLVRAILTKWSFKTIKLAGFMWKHRQNNQRQKTNWSPYSLTTRRSKLINNCRNANHNLPWPMFALLRLLPRNLFKFIRLASARGKGFRSPSWGFWKLGFGFAAAFKPLRGQSEEDGGSVKEKCQLN